MSKSRGNAIAIGATADETAALIKRAKTDLGAAQHHARPGAAAGGVEPPVARGALHGRTPDELAEEIRWRRGLKRVVTEAVNERFRAIRARRAELVADRAYRAV